MSPYPDIQEMDMNYERYYLVPWPDFQRFQELDPDGLYTVPVTINDSPFCFVDAEWIADDYPDALEELE